MSPSEISSTGRAGGRIEDLKINFDNDVESTIFPEDAICDSTMYEENTELEGVDTELVQQILSIEVRETPGRQHVYERVSMEVKNLRTTMLSVAEKNGIEIPQEDIDNWRPEEAASELLSHKLGPQRKQLQIMDGIEDYNQGVEELRQGTKLRKDQNKTLETLGSFLETTPADQTGGKIALIQLPTGAGKSGIIAKIAEAAKFNENPDDPVKVIVLEPTQKLVDQIVGDDKDEAAGFKKFAPNLTVGKYFQDAKDTDDSVIAMCTASFNILAEKGELPDADIIIADEAHMLGPTTRANLEKYKEGKTTIGLTATPAKAIEMFGDPIVEMTAREAIEDYGILSPVRKAELLEATPLIDVASLPKDPEARRADIKEAYFQARLKVATPKIVDATKRGLGVIVRCPAGDDINYAKRAAAALREEFFSKDGVSIEQVRAIEVGGSEQRTVSGKKFKNHVLGEFDRGGIHVATHVKQIGVGSDFPRAKLYVDLDPTANPDTITQNFGRVLRKYKDPETNELVAAESLEFIDPNLGERQHTAIKVLRLEPGEESLEYKALHPVRQPNRESKITETKAESDIALNGIQSRVLDVESVELKGPIETYSEPFPDGLTVKEASNWFGVSPPTLKNVLGQMGGADLETLSSDDMELISIYYPGLTAPSFPEDGSDYVSIPEAMSIASFQDGKPAVFVRDLQYQGLVPARFRTDNGIEKFFNREALEQFLDSQTKDPN